MRALRKSNHRAASRQRGRPPNLTRGPPGNTAYEGVARGIVWWPSIDSDLEAKVKTCNACQVNRKSPPVVPLHPWEFPARPWSRLHIDFAGPFLGKMFVVLVDAYSKWFKVAIVSTYSSQQAIKFSSEYFRNSRYSRTTGFR